METFVIMMSLKGQDPEAAASHGCAGPVATNSETVTA